MLCHPFQGVDNSQEFPDIIGSLLVGTGMEDLVTCLCKYTAVFQYPGGSITCGIHTNRGKDRLDTCVLPFPQGRRLALIRIIRGAEGSLRFLAAAKRLVLCAGKTPHLFLGCSPGGVNTWLASPPYHIEFLLGHMSR